MNSIDFTGRQGKPIVVVGSLNMDLVMRTPRVPVGGETLHGHEFSTLPGGKGANQAVACARLGAKVRMIGQVGNDGFGTHADQPGIDQGLRLEPGDDAGPAAAVPGRGRLDLAHRL